MASKVLNFNIGILGHVDSGKTSLAKALSTTGSTASFDKNPQSQERGITIDLGFSSLSVQAPPHIAKKGFTELQYTFVDCPGHGSLIRTIIGGAQIIDAFLLVVDITKGIQTQTAECIVIGNILCPHLLIVLNKLDLILKEKQKSAVEKVTRRLRSALQSTQFVNSPIVSVAANPGGAETSSTKPLLLDELIDSIKSLTYVPERKETEPFVFAVDHCFTIKGQGTVLTGTVLQGAINVNENIEIPSLKLSKKIKSIQMFRKPVDRAYQGDRVGICVTQFDPTLLERGVVGAPSYIILAYAFIAQVEKISYYTLPVHSKAKFHVSIGHETLVGKVTFFGTEVNLTDEEFDFGKEYIYLDELVDPKKLEPEAIKPTVQFALVEFERPVPCVPLSLVIGSKLDMDVQTSTCRLAFCGRSRWLFTDKSYSQNALDKLKVFKKKSKEGVIERMANDSEVIVRNLLKKETDVSLFAGLKVHLSSGEDGVIDGMFGQSGKVKVRVPTGLKEETKCKLQLLKPKKKGKTEGKEETAMQDVTPIKVELHFKKYIFCHQKKIIQT